MKKIRTWVEQMNFKKTFKWYLVVSLAAVLLCGVMMYRTQVDTRSTYTPALNRENSEIDVRGDWQNQGEYQNEGGWRSEDAEPDLGLFAAVFILLFLAYWLLVAGWLYQTAVLSGMSGLFWLLAALGTNLLAVILFIMARSVLRKKCAVCGHWQLGKANFCAQCGVRMGRRCPSCGEQCANGDQFCSACGTKLNENLHDTTEAESGDI